MPKAFGQNGHQFAQNRPDNTFELEQYGHNSVIFHPIFEDKSNGNNI